jgi:hypothetical protein
MLIPAPIDKTFVPYTKRLLLKHNASLFVDAGKANVPRVVPQVKNCSGKPDCWGPCHTFPDGTALYCKNGECVATASECGR